MDSKILFVNKDGYSMIMDSDEDYEINIPMTIRYYPKLGTIASAIGFATESPIGKVSSKKADKFIIYELTLHCTKFTGNKADFIVTGYENEPDDVKNMLIGEIDSRLDFWFRKQCVMASYLARPQLYHRGHICYWYNANVTAISELTVHVYGNTIIDTSNLSNVLIYVHDPETTKVI